MKNHLKAVKAALAKVELPKNNVHRTSLDKFTPHVAPGLQIAVALVSGDNIEVHYQPRVR